MLRSRITWLIPVTLTLVALSSNVKSAIAATFLNTYDFSIDYQTSVETKPADQQGNITVTVTGINNQAPYGLNFFISEAYGKLQPSDDPSIIRYNFNADPGVIGLEPDPNRLSDRYYGGANELFGKAKDSAEINLKAGTIKGGGTITITGGTGLFQNATGTIAFTQEDKLNADPTVPSKGLAKLKFSLQTQRTVPETTPTTTLAGIGVIGAGLVVRRHRRKVTMS